MDALIIGAGPAGAIAGLTLAEKGYKVAIFEKGPLKREKVCGGGVPEIALREFSLDFEKGTPVHGIVMYSPENKKAVLTQKERAGVAVMRSEFDYYLMEKARKAGARINEHTPAQPFIEHGTLKGVKTPQKDYFSPIVIICDGALSPSSRLLGVYTGSAKNQAVGFQYQMALDDEMIQQRIGNLLEMYFGSQWAPSGYAWIFPKKGLVTVGNATWLNILEKKQTNLKSLLDHFIQHHPVASEKLKGARILYAQTHLLSFRGIVKSVYGDHFVIAGDAGGFNSYATGGGLYYAMVSGNTAGEVAAEALEQGDFSRRFLKDYEKRVNKKIGADMKWGFLLRKLFLTKDLHQELFIQAINQNTWVKQLSIQLLKEEIRYDQFLKELALHPHEIIKSLI